MLESTWFAEFTYRKSKDDCWELKEQHIDGRVKTLLSVELARMERITLPSVNAESRPWAHLALLVKILGQANLASGSIKEQYGRSDNDEETYTATIQLANPRSAYHAE